MTGTPGDCSGRILSRPRTQRKRVSIQLRRVLLLRKKPTQQPARQHAYEKQPFRQNAGVLRDITG